MPRQVHLTAQHSQAPDEIVYGEGCLADGGIELAYLITSTLCEQTLQQAQNARTLSPMT